MDESFLNLLLVEDNPGDIILTSEMLYGTQLKIAKLHIAESLEAALTISAEQDIDVALVDLSLPDSFGMDTFLKIQEANPNIPIIVLSGLSDEEVAYETVRLGAQDYLIKGNFDEMVMNKVIKYSIERKRHLDTIQASEARYKFLFDANPMALFMYEEDTLNIKMVNDAACYLYGYSKEEFHRMNIRDIRPPEDIPLVKAYVQSSRNENHSYSAGEWRHQKKDGTIMYVEINSMRVEFDDKMQRVVSVNDTTARKEMLDHLKLLESVITNSLDAIMITQPMDQVTFKADIEYTNPAFEKITGFSDENIDEVTLKSFIGPLTDLQEVQRLRDHCNSGIPYEGELLVYNKHGAHYWSNIAVFPVRDNLSQKIKHLIWVHRNIDERKRIESEQLLLTQELVRQNQDLQEFSFIASHQLKAPAANLIGLLNLFNLNNLTDPKNIELIHMFRRASEQLNETLSDLVQNLVVRHNIHAEKEVVRIYDVCLNVKEKVLNNLDIPEVDITCEFNVDEEIHYSRSHLEGIFTHMLTNAIKYKHPERKLKLKVFTEKTDGYTVIHIEDNGLGIDLERYGNRIFGLYQTFHRNKYAKGLGLFTVASMLKANGGKITIDSEVDKGSTFHLYFPN